MSADGESRGRQTFEWGVDEIDPSTRPKWQQSAAMIIALQCRHDRLGRTIATYPAYQIDKASLVSKEIGDGDVATLTPYLHFEPTRIVDDVVSAAMNENN